MNLLIPRPPPLREGIDLRCCDAAEMIATLDGPADLVIADPPWTYGQRYGASEPPYPCLPTDTIVDHLRGARASRLALWMTWPLMPEWVAATTGWPWRWVTGGAWAKSDGEAGHYGPGHHWAGCSEPVMIYTRGAAGYNAHSSCRNVWTSAESNHTPTHAGKVHSVKPARWMAQWIRRWVEPGGLVVDPYAGLGSVAEAVILAGGGRRYIGSEIDPERHAAALALLAQVRA